MDQLGFWTKCVRAPAWVKLVIFFSLFLAYWLSYPWGIIQVGNTYRVVAFVYLIPAAMFWGFWGGVCSLLGGVGLGFALHNFMGLHYPGGVVGPLGGLSVALIVSYMRSVGLRLDSALTGSLAMERELVRYKGRLEEMVQKRTLELSEVNQRLHDEVEARRGMESDRLEIEEKLHRSQKMVALGALAGGIAHDFNNILSAMMGYAELTRNSPQTLPATRETMEKILASGQRAADLIKQILAFSRQSEQEMQPLQTRLILKEAIKMLKATLTSSITIEENINSRASIMADPGQVHQVIMNLCVNAGQAMHPGGGVLSITLDEILDSAGSTSGGPRPMQRLVVSDTGHGMDNRTLEKIFQPFFTTKSQQGGTGIGLSVTHGIIKNLGGEITVSSAPGQGSSFRVLLPILQQGAAPGHPPSQPAAMPSGSEHILLVDDEAVLVEIGSEVLEHLGFRTSGFTDSTAALKAFAEAPHSFDAVMSDLHMPRLDGLGLIAAIKEIRPETPVLLCTGFSELLEPEQLTKAGVDKMIMKPILAREIGAALREVIDQAA